MTILSSRLSRLYKDRYQLVTLFYQGIQFANWLYERKLDHQKQPHLSLTKFLEDNLNLMNESDRDSASRASA